MKNALSESAIVRSVAQGAAQRITRKVIASLQHMGEKLSGEGSEVISIWDEICVQVQYERSLSWKAYDQSCCALIAGYIAELPKYEREALWLQTDAGNGWECELPEERATYPVSDGEIVEYLAQEYLYTEAGRWSNSRIRAYIDRSSMRD